MIEPIEIKQADPRTMAIVWNDGRETAFAFSLLRRECPCATCRKMREEKPLEKEPGGFVPLRVATDDAPSADPKLKKVDWVGNYALKLTWDDGHDTGIYAFDYLIGLADREPGSA